MINSFAFKYAIIVFLFFKNSHCLKLENAIELLHNFDSIDPDLINLFSKKVGSYKNRDINEVDLLEVDTNDILNCFNTLSYTCFQKKILVYLDAINRVDKVNVFGGYISFVRIAGEKTPPITEQFLASRRINDNDSLTMLLKAVFDDFVDNHIVRFTVPFLNAKLEARSSSNQCYEFSLSGNYTTISGNGTAYDSQCYRGDRGMSNLGSAMTIKMFMLIPTIMKIIAAKAMFGLVMGFISVLLSKMAILPHILSQSGKSTVTYRQRITPPVTPMPTANAFEVYENTPSSTAIGPSPYEIYEPPSFSGPELTSYDGNNWVDKSSTHDIETNRIGKNQIYHSEPRGSPTQQISYRGRNLHLMYPINTENRIIQPTQ